MTTYTPPHRPKQPAESETEYVRDCLEHARHHQAAVEAAREAAGGVYDPILRRWVPCEVQP